MQAVAKAAVELQAVRDKAIGPGVGFRELYRLMGLPGANPLKDVHAALNDAVRAAYGMAKKEDPLQFLLDLNAQIAQDEKAAKPVVRPGLPSVVANRKAFVTQDCLRR